MQELQYWEVLSFLLVVALLWIALIVFVRRSLVQEPTALRFVALATFIALFVAVFFFLQSMLVSLVEGILPVLWAFTDSYLSQKVRTRHVTLILKSRIGYCSELWDSIRDEITKVLPDIKLDVVINPKEENASEQETIFDREVAKRPEAIMIVPPPENEHLIPTAIKAFQKNIPLITIDDAFDPNKFISEGLLPPIHIGSHFDRGGRLAAHEMLRALAGKEKIAIVSGPVNSRPSQERKLAFIDEILHARKRCSFICSEAPWNREEAKQRMAELLKTHGVVDGIFCCNDHLALGVADALREYREQGLMKDRPYPVIIGFDGIKEIKDPIWERQVHCSIDVQISVQGKYVVDQLALILSKKDDYFRRRKAPGLTIPTLLSRSAIRAS